MTTNEELTIKRLSFYLTQQLNLCILKTQKQGEVINNDNLYWAGAKSSAQALLDLVSEDNLNDALVEHILDGDDIKLT